MLSLCYNVALILALLFAILRLVRWVREEFHRAFSSSDKAAMSDVADKAKRGFMGWFKKKD